MGRGDLLAPPEDPPQVTRELDAELCWLAEAPRAGARLR